MSASCLVLEQSCLISFLQWVGQSVLPVTLPWPEAEFPKHVLIEHMIYTSVTPCFLYEYMNEAREFLFELKINALGST